MTEASNQENGRFRYPFFAGSLIAAGMGLVAILGWIVRSPFLTGFGPANIPMAPSTAVLFALLGGASYLRDRYPSHPGMRRAGTLAVAACSAASFSIGVLSFSGIHPALEHLGMTIDGTIQGLPLGHMSPVTAAYFLLACLSFLLSSRSPAEDGIRLRLARWSASLLIVLSALLLVAYIIGRPLFYAGGMIPPAATTGVAFLALGISLLGIGFGDGKVAFRRAEPVTREEYALVLVFVLLAAGIVAAGHFLFQRFEKNHRTQLESQLSSIASLKVSGLQQFREERSGDASILFGNPSFTRLVKSALASTEDFDAQRQLRAWIEKYWVYPDYDRIFLLDRRGAVRMSSREAAEPVGSAILEGAAEALRTGQPVFVDLYRNEYDDEVYMASLVPVLDERKNPLGVLVLRIDPKVWLYPFLKHWPTHHRTAETLLVRRDRDYAVFLNELKYRDDPPLSVSIPLDPEANVPAVQAVLGREGIMEGVDYRGVPVMAELRKISGTQWFLVARMDLSEVYAPVRERLWLTMFLVVFMFLSAGAGVGLIWRHQRARSYRERYESERERAWLQDVISRSLNEVYVFDPETLRFKYVNAGAARNLGYGTEELARMTPVDIKPRYTEESFREMIRPLASGERGLVVFETVHRRKDGSEYPAEIHLQLLPAAEGPVFLAIVNDITDRKTAEERVRRGLQIETALRRIDTEILEGANIREALSTACGAIVEMGYRMCWVGRPDADRMVRPVAVAGEGAEYVEGLDLHWGDGHERSGPTGIAIRTGRPFVVEWISESQAFGPWRDRAAQYGFRSMASFPLKSGDGDMIGVLNVYSGTENAFSQEEIGRLQMFAQQCSIAMMSARRLESLRDANQRLKFHVSRMPLAYIAWDMEFRVREWNPAAERIFGWKASEALGKHAYDLVVQPEVRPYLDGVWAKLLEKGEPEYSLNANVRKDGKAISCEWFNTALRDAEGNVTAVLSMAHDVTEKTELQRQLQTAQRMEAVGTLAGGIAHDFNNALTGIFGFAEMLKGQLEGNEAALSDLNEIFRSAERASLLTRQLLTFARRQVIELSNIGLNRVIMDLMKLFSKAIGEQIDLRTYLAKDLPSVRADIGQIEQVVMNLVLNARDAMPGGGQLLIETGLANLDADYVRYHPYMQVGSYVVLTVSDTGTGMDRKTQERVFEPFFTTKGPDKGTGLGMAMVYGIVKQHNGFIHLYSEPGKGTTFKVYLPPVEAPPDERSASSALPAPRGGTETVLVAEDDESVRMLVDRTLTDLGYTVLVARDGAEAVELFRESGDRVALAILDVVMPRMGGKEAYEKMHRMRPGLKVLFMSGYTANVVHESFVLIAGVPFLAKPLGPGALAAKVREVLDRK
ncbi:MAG: PAS domain S-box protein [Thermodesulfobacteriota bacterium]